MNNNSKELLKLMTENPNLPVVPFVWYEVCADDNNYWMGSIGSCRVDEYCTYNEKYFDNKEELKEEFFNCNEEDYKFTISEEIEKDLEEKTKDMWIKAILVYIELPGEVSNE